MINSNYEYSFRIPLNIATIWNLFLHTILSQYFLSIEWKLENFKSKVSLDEYLYFFCIP